MINRILRASLTILTAGAMLAPVSASAQPEEPPIDPAATALLKRMTDYVGGLEQFSVNTQSTLEDLTDSGHRIDLDVSAHAVINRPNRVRAQRLDPYEEEVFYYNGETLTLYDPEANVYASTPAPATIDPALVFAQEKLDLIIPVSDLVYNNSYSLLMQDVTMAMVVGKAYINGARCDQLLFSRPGVDFQLWILESGPPLPLKLVVTDTGTPELLSISTVMSDWDMNPDVSASQFTFTPREGDTEIAFLSMITASGAEN